MFAQINNRGKTRYLKGVLFAALLLFANLGTLFSQSGPARVVTIEKAIEELLTNNLQIKQAQFQESLSEQDLLQARMNFFPNINAGASGGKNWGLSFDQTAGKLVTQSVQSAGAQLSTGVDIFQGFQRINQVKANRYQLLANQSNVERIKSDLILAMVTNYLEALTNYDLWEASREQHQLSREQLQIMEIQVEAGNNTLADLSQAQAQVATDELNITTAQNAYELSMLNLKQLMEWDPATSMDLVRPSVESVRLHASRMDAPEIVDRAIADYPEIKVAEYNTLAAERRVAMARGGLFPSLSFSAAIGTNYSSQAVDFATQQILPFGDQLRQNRGESIGFSLSIPIFNRYSTRIGINRAKINYQNALSSEQLAKNNFNKIIHQAVLDLRSAEKRLAATESALAAARKAFEVIRLRFEEGLATSIEQSTAQTTMNRAEFDYIQAQYELVFRSKVIDFYLGNPIRF